MSARGRGHRVPHWIRISRHVQMSLSTGEYLVPTLPTYLRYFVHLGGDTCSCCARPAAALELSLPNTCRVTGPVTTGTAQWQWGRAWRGLAAAPDYAGKPVKANVLQRVLSSSSLPFPPPPTYHQSHCSLLLNPRFFLSFFQSGHHQQTTFTLHSTTPRFFEFYS